MGKTTLGKCVLVCAATLTLLSCSSSGDTVVAVNFAFDDSAADVKSNAATLHIKVGTTETDFTVTRSDAGDITSGAWKRVIVNGKSGKVTVTLTARDGSGKTLLELSKDVELVENGSIEVFLKLVPTAPSAGGTGGSSGSGGTGAGGSGTGGSGAGGSGAGGSGAGGSGAGGGGAGGTDAGGTT